MKSDINYADLIPVRKFHVNRHNLLFLKQHIVKISSYFYKNLNLDFSVLNSQLKTENLFRTIICDFTLLTKRLLSSQEGIVLEKFIP
jgi:hypothetical protein